MIGCSSGSCLMPRRARSSYRPGTSPPITGPR
jgi:hypothetical protein